MELIIGWKGVMNVFRSIGADFHLRTIKEWHYKRLRIPFRKTYQSQQGRVYISKAELLNWLDEVTQVPKQASSGH